METKNIESFSKIIRDLIHDLDTTFPEYKEKYQSISNSLDHPEAGKKKSTESHRWKWGKYRS